jgi:hypothetical protein
MFSDAKDVIHNLEQGWIIDTAVFAEGKEAVKLSLKKKWPQLLKRHVCCLQRNDQPHMDKVILNMLHWGGVFLTILFKILIYDHVSYTCLFCSKWEHLESKYLSGMKNALFDWC